MPSPSPDLTQYLQRVAEGDQQAMAELLPQVYDHLIHLARKIRREKGAGPTLNTTALVHEAYLKLINQPQYENRVHFFRVAARAMRQVIFNYVEYKLAAKRGHQPQHESLEELEIAVPPHRWEEAFSLEQSLRRLEQIHQRPAQVLECRFFGGMSVEETGMALQISPATVKRDWNLARAWLYQQLNEKPSPPHG